jgi:hypothetical protein
MLPPSGPPRALQAFRDSLARKRLVALKIEVAASQFSSDLFLLRKHR